MAGRRFFGRVNCWTRDDTTALVFILTGWLPTSSLTKVRATTFRMDSNSGDAWAQCGYRTCDNPDDRTDWSSVTGFGPTRTSDGDSFEATGFTDVSSAVAAQRYIQFVVACKNNTASSSVTEACQITVELDIQD